MGKYFSNDSDLLNYAVTDDNSVDVTNAIPHTDNLTQPLSDETKQKLTEKNHTDTISTEDEYINIVKEQSIKTSDMIQKYSDESKQEIKNQFAKFAPAELFEKMNQILFVLTTLSNKVDTLEKTILQNVKSVDNTTNNGKLEVRNPADLYKIQQTEKINTTSEKDDTPIIPHSIPNKSQKVETSPQMPDVNEVKKQLENIKKGIKPRMPGDGYTDKSVNLEQMFPNLDDEAYQAAYRAIDQQQNPGDSTTSTKPEPGKMRGLNGF